MFSSAYQTTGIFLGRRVLIVANINSIITAEDDGEDSDEEGERREEDLDEEEGEDTGELDSPVSLSPFFRIRY